MTNNKSLKIVFFGTPEFVIPVLSSLLTNFTVVSVVTTPDSIQTRKKQLTPSPIKKYTLKHIPTAQILNNPNLDTETFKKLKDISPDLFVVAAYGVIIPKNILEIPKYGAINIHPSLLPKYRGPSPIQTALLRGEKENGITIIKLDEEIDHGPILKKIKFDIKPSDTFDSLHTKMFQKASIDLPKVVIDYVEGKITPLPQNHKAASFTKHISKKDGYFDLNNPPTKDKLHRMILAYYPWPTVWTKIDIKGKEIRIKFLPEKNIQLEGGKKMLLKDFYNGYPELKEKIENLF